MRLRSQAGIRSPRPLGVKERHSNSTCSVKSHWGLLSVGMCIVESKVQGKLEGGPPGPEQRGK